MLQYSWHLWTVEPLGLRFSDSSILPRKMGSLKIRSSESTAEDNRVASRTNKCHLFPTGGHFGTPNKLPVGRIKKPNTNEQQRRTADESLNISNETNFAHRTGNTSLTRGHSARLLNFSLAQTQLPKQQQKIL